MPERDAANTQPAPAELLRAALEKIVFFEWRLSELAAELSAAQSRCASMEQERVRTEEDLRTAEQEKTYRAEIETKHTLKARLYALARIREREGYMADRRQIGAVYAIFACDPSGEVVQKYLAGLGKDGIHIEEVSETGSGGKPAG